MALIRKSLLWFLDRASFFLHNYKTFCTSGWPHLEGMVRFETSFSLPSAQSLPEGVKEVPWGRG